MIPTHRIPPFRPTRRRNRGCASTARAAVRPRTRGSPDDRTSLRPYLDEKAWLGEERRRLRDQVPAHPVVRVGRQRPRVRPQPRIVRRREIHPWNGLHALGAKLGQALPHLRMRPRPPHRQFWMAFAPQLFCTHNKAHSSSYSAKKGRAEAGSRGEGTMKKGEHVSRHSRLKFQDN